MRDNLNFAITGLRDLDGVPQVADAVFDFDSVVQELLEGRDVENLIIDRLGGVDDVLFGQNCQYKSQGLPYWAKKNMWKNTFFVTFCCFPLAVRAYSTASNPGREEVVSLLFPHIEEVSLESSVP